MAEHDGSAAHLPDLFDALAAEPPCSLVLGVSRGRRLCPSCCAFSSLVVAGICASSLPAAASRAARAASRSRMAARVGALSARSSAPNTVRIASPSRSRSCGCVWLVPSSALLASSSCSSSGSWYSRRRGHLVISNRSRRPLSTTALALESYCPRSASITCTDPGSLMAIVLVASSTLRPLPPPGTRTGSTLLTARQRRMNGDRG